MFEPTTEQDADALASETKMNLVDVFAGENRRVPTAVGRSAVIVAEDESGGLVGACGIQALSLTPDGRGEELMSSLDAASRRQMELRPLLSNVAVVPAQRRRGIGSRLVAEGEELVRAWGYDELLLLVGEANVPAQQLYASRGYVVEGVPLDGEECAVSAWYLGGGITWRACKNVCMRRRGLLLADDT